VKNLTLFTEPNIIIILVSNWGYVSLKNKILNNFLDCSCIIIIIIYSCIYYLVNIYSLIYISVLTIIFQAQQFTGNWNNNQVSQGIASFLYRSAVIVAYWYNQLLVYWSTLWIEQFLRGWLPHLWKDNGCLGNRLVQEVNKLWKQTVERVTIFLKIFSHNPTVVFTAKKYLLFEWMKQLCFFSL